VALMKKELTCSFCGSKYMDYEQLIAGKNGVYICRNCVSSCNTLFEEKYKSNPERVLDFSVQKPMEMKAELDKYVIGQEKAKKVLSVAVYNHYKRVQQNVRGDDIQKSNVLLVGPTGSGKTYLVQSLAKIIGVPIAIADATSLTEAGYVGDDVENVLLRLVQAADGDIAEAEHGIIYIDEIDKIARKSENMSLTRDVSGEGVQQALLKIIEGTVATVPAQGGRKHPQANNIQINTKDILFICGGAFAGMKKQSESTQKAIGFLSGDVRQLPETKVGTADLVKYGMIPEFIGRLPIICELEELDEDALVRILTEPQNAITKQYQRLLRIDGIYLKFTEAALRMIARKALQNGTGARGIRAILEEIMLDVMYEAPSFKNRSQCTITPELIEKTLSGDNYELEKGA